MIIACGVLSCVAVLLGIIILEIALDRRQKAKKLTDEQTSSVEQPAEEPVKSEDSVVEEPIVAEERTLSVETSAEVPAQTSYEEKPVEETKTEEEPVIEDEPVEVVVPASEPIIEEAPAPIEELPHIEDIIAGEPAVVIEHTPAEAPAAEETPVIEEPAIGQASPDEMPAYEPAHSEAYTVAEEAAPIIEEEPAATENSVEPEITEEDNPAVLNESEDLDEPDDGAIYEDPTAEDVDDEVASELKVVVKDGQTRYIVIKYSKSFEAKLIQGTDDAKRYYSELKNCLLSYGVKSNLVKSRMSWKWEAFRYGRKTLARLRLRGKTVSVVLALNPDDYKDTKYLVESVADIACYADTPALCRIKSERRLKYTKELIAKMMQDNGLTQKPDFVPVNYAPLYPYDTTENLVERKLVKVLTDEDAQSGEVFKPSDIRKSVKAQDVDNILQDDIAVELIEKLDGVSDRTKSGIINIDTLSQNFRDGETVTVEEIRKRVKGYNKVTYIKVLARGTLDKRLTVEADDFSLQAVKMIVLIGGKVIKK